jgi:hypothetical protein
LAAYSFWPASERRKSTNALAAVGFLLLAATATGFSIRMVLSGTT